MVVKCRDLFKMSGRRLKDVCVRWVENKLKRFSNVNIVKSRGFEKTLLILVEKDCVGFKQIHNHQLRHHQRSRDFQKWDITPYGFVILDANLSGTNDIIIIRSRDFEFKKLLCFSKGCLRQIGPVVTICKVTNIETNFTVSSV